MEFIITDEYKKIIKDINDGVKQIFITGNAGTGKSTLLSYIKTLKKSIVVAPTGVAAVNVGGMTIHSFFKICPTEANIYKSAGLTGKKAEVLFKTDLIIIDEISMVSSLLLDQINMVCQRTLKSKDPFGGKQVVMFGDIGQLQPVAKDSLKKHLDKLYPSIMFFDSYVFKNCPNAKFHILTKNFRQSDVSFSEILDAIRIGKVTSQHISILNKRKAGDDMDDEKSIYLAGTNEVVDMLNNLKVDSIKGKNFYFKAKVIGNFKVNNTILVDDLNLKAGCKVMVLANDPKGEYVNGTLAIFEGYDNEENKVIVSIKGKDYKLAPIVHEEIQYDLDNKGEIKSDVTGSFQQFPLKVGYAITVHKAQGMTFDNVVLLNGRGFWGEGQAYVAFSRCRTLEGIILEDKISSNDFKVNKYSINWLNEKLIQNEN